MGCINDDGECTTDYRPVHTVHVPRFALSKYEVTFAQWDACLDAGGCNDYRPHDRGWGRGNLPVMRIRWSDAQAYVEWLSQQTGEQYRLPSESEWEYAARAGTETKYHWGDRIGRNRANCDGCGSQWDGSRTAPVGSFSPNAWGLHDMHGNVLEWTADCSNRGYAGAPTDGSAWLSGDCSGRVARSGGWDSDPRFIRAAFRSRADPGFIVDVMGFRVALSLEVPASSDGDGDGGDGGNGGGDGESDGANAGGSDGDGDGDGGGGDGDSNGANAGGSDGDGDGDDGGNGNNDGGGGSGGGDGESDGGSAGNNEGESNGDSDDDGVLFPDEGLARAVAQALDVPSVTRANTTEVAMLTSLSSSRFDVIDLTGLETATNLKSLNLGNNKITNATALSSLGGLVNLTLSWNSGLTDLSDLSGLNSLRTLLLDGIGAADMTPLARLTRLERLSLSSNPQVLELEALSNLVNLKSLSLDRIGAHDLSPLSSLTNLSNLSLTFNPQIQDLTALSSLTKLKSLRLDGIGATDLTALSGLTGLESLTLTSN